MYNLTIKITFFCLFQQTIYLKLQIPNPQSPIPNPQFQINELTNPQSRINESRIPNQRIHESTNQQFQKIRSP